MNIDTNTTPIATLTELNNVETLLKQLMEQNILPVSYQRTVASMFKKTRLHLANKY
jgi:hypothetical protein